MALRKIDTDIEYWAYLETKTQPELQELAEQIDPSRLPKRHAMVLTALKKWALTQDLPLKNRLRVSSSASAFQRSFFIPIMTVILVLVSANIVWHQGINLASGAFVIITIFAFVIFLRRHKDIPDVFLDADNLYVVRKGRSTTLPLKQVTNIELISDEGGNTLEISTTNHTDLGPGFRFLPASIVGSTADSKGSAESLIRQTVLWARMPKSLKKRKKYGS